MDHFWNFGLMYQFQTMLLQAISVVAAFAVKRLPCTSIKPHGMGTKAGKLRILRELLRGQPVDIRLWMIIDHRMTG